MSEHTALIVDDEPDICELLEITLGRMGIETRAVGTLDAARAALRERRYDLCLTDMRLPDGDGLDLVAEIGRQHAGLPVAVITAHGNMEAAVRALKAGAFDFVAKPVELNDLRNLVGQALQPAARAGDATTDGGHRLIGESPVIDHLRHEIGKVARSQAPVVITGESGSGKELVARLIHEQGPRAEQPFVPLNCGAVPRELVESELFGHRRGAFTGATGDKQGLFAAAHGGTLFLDEIVELPLDMQVKLLRAVQEKRIRPVGATEEQPVDVRIICASHASLEEAVRTGHFREDLYYRIHVIGLRVPPLRVRPGDIPVLAEHILERRANEYAIPRPVLTDTARQQLEAYSFPGNVRELENILERALAMAEGERVEAADLRLETGACSAAVGDAPTPPDQPPHAANTATEAAPPATGSLDDHMEARQRAILVECLERNRWNRTAAARELGLTYRQLRYRLKKLGID